MALDKKSLKMLAGVHPDLVKVVKAVSEFKDLPQWQVTYGLRTLEQEKEMIRKGYSSLKNPMNCRHVPSGTPPLGHAIDISVLVGGKPCWANQYRSSYIKIGQAFQKAAQDLNIPLRSGFQWKTFLDLGHHELPAAQYS